jgi:hypothetical protein
MQYHDASQVGNDQITLLRSPTTSTCRRTLQDLDCQIECLEVDTFFLEEKDYYELTGDEDLIKQHGSSGMAVFPLCLRT